jgi:hypothetical protein
VRALLAVREVVVANDIGKVRRSAVLANFAPGAVSDFRSGRAAISGVIAGLEEWDRSAGPAGLVNPQVIHEPRLERSLGVKGFRLPFVIDEEWRDENGDPDTRRLVAARMPRWLQCPLCERIAPAQQWANDPGHAERFCAGCNRGHAAADRRYCVPVRFVFACDGGHLDDFPWHRWVGHLPDCQERQFLHLTSRGPGLAGLILSCPRCKASRSMDGIFSEETWTGYFCSGRRPWLAGADEACQRQPRAVQRGASNLYFPAISSALSIPPWSDELQEQLGIYWDPIIQVDEAQRGQFIATLAQSVLGDVLRALGLTAESLSREISRRLELLARPQILDIRGEEYRQFALGTGDAGPGTREFECRPEQVPQALRPYFDRILRAVRLREVRALRGFTRINPPEDNEGAEIAALSSNRLDWLPGIEVRGEGIFLKLAEGPLSDWENRLAVRERAARVNTAWHAEWRQRHPEGDPPYDITARYLLVHTLAHVLMRQLTLDCGYSSAALRERLYVDGGDAQMAGLLIYTSTSDTDGTLGGLQRQGMAHHLAGTIPAALRAIEWCSSDPLCIGDIMAGADGLSLAACHACVLAPETACETFNRFLDRGMLIGMPDDREIGFFAPLLRET